MWRVNVGDRGLALVGGVCRQMARGRAKLPEAVDSSLPSPRTEHSGQSGIDRSRSGQELAPSPSGRASTDTSFNPHGPDGRIARYGRAGALGWYQGDVRKPCPTAHTSLVSSDTNNGSICGNNGSLVIADRWA
ncbi:hypothetical protein Bbelb_382620 [Branchiostoma belcheri]|nr:hypothetical protein Bbelb_382620 [Branchiostoma belcheri]